MPFIPLQPPAGLDTDGLRKHGEEQHREIARAWTEVEKSIVDGDAANTTAIAANAAAIAAVVAEVDALQLLVPITTLSNSLGADVALNATGTYFTGPSVAQGTVGTWFVSVSVTLTDTAGSALFRLRLWDGTTIIASAAVNSASATSLVVVTLSGVITSPVGNIRMSVRDVSSTSGFIRFNTSTDSKDSTLTAMRIA